MCTRSLLLGVTTGYNTIPYLHELTITTTYINFQAQKPLPAGTFLCVGFSLPPCGVCLLCAGAVHGSFSNKTTFAKIL